MRVMKQEELLNLLTAAKLYQYGVQAEPLAERLQRCLRTRAGRQAKEPLCVVAALNNADTNGALLEALRQEPAKALEGIHILADSLKAKKRILMLPSYAAELARDAQLQKAAADHKVEIGIGLVDMRANQLNVVVHIITAAELADVVAGCYVPGVYVSPNGTGLQKLPLEMTVRDALAQAGCDVSQVRALELGYGFAEVEAMNLPLGQAQITNGVLNAVYAGQCVIHEVEQRLAASRKQGCGKCVFCREGLGQLCAMYADIKAGKGKNEYKDLIREIGSAMTGMCGCSLGAESPKVALSSLSLFGEEYGLHIQKKACTAGLCFHAGQTYIDPWKCIGCQECEAVCPQGCIDGAKNYIHMIDSDACTQCGQCAAVCEYDAIITTDQKLPKLPDRLTKAGRFKKRG